MSVAPATLTGRMVRLEPLGPAHRDGLRLAADDDRIWRHTTGDGFDDWLDPTLERRAPEGQVPFAVRPLAGGRLVGSASYLDPVSRHLLAELESHARPTG